MSRTILLLLAVVAFLLAVLAIQGHAAVVEVGYSIRRLEREVHDLEADADLAREEVSRLRAPARLLARAREFGLAPDTMIEALVRASRARAAATPLLAQR